MSNNETGIIIDMNECPICFNKIKNDNKYITECNHEYCKACLDKWFDIKPTIKKVPKIFYLDWSENRPYPTNQAIFYEDSGVRRRMLRNMRRSYIRNIIMKLREYE